MELQDLDNSNECSICLLSLTNSKNKKLQCNHVFHYDCIEKWLNIKNICPLCRAPGPERTQYYIGYCIFWSYLFKYKIYLKNTYLQIKYLCRLIEIPYSSITSICLYGLIFEINYYDEDRVTKKKVNFKFRSDNILVNLFNSIKTRINIISNRYVIQ